MDVIGTNPKSKSGTSFLGPSACWRPIATYVCELAPDITAKCKYWWNNDCDGLNGDDSVLLADLLQKEIDSGRAAEYARLRPQDGDVFSPEDVQEFVYFLRSCGGF